MTDNIAVMEGYTRELMARDKANEIAFPVLVKPDADLNSELLRVWNMDEQEFVMLRGMAWAFTEVFTDL